MLYEQISLNGAPVVGFGASEGEEKKFYGTMVGVPLLGIVAGAAGGALLAHKKGGTVATATGAVVGAFAGGASGVALALIILRVGAKQS